MTYRNHPVDYPGDPRSLDPREERLWPMSMLIGLAAVIGLGTIGVLAILMIGRL